MWYYCDNCSKQSYRYVFMYIVGGALQMNCGNCFQPLVRASSQAEAIVNKFTNKQLVNQWQTFDHNYIPYSCCIYGALQPVGYGHNVDQLIGPQVGPQQQRPKSPTRVFTNKNQDATATEVLIGEYLLFELEAEGVQKIVGAAELKHTRSADYRLHYKDGTVLPADLYECNTSNTQNAVSYIQGKWDQADTIIILLPTNTSLNCDTIINQLKLTAVPTHDGTYVVPRRLLFITPNPITGLPAEMCFKVVKDHKFFDKPQSKLFRGQL